MDSESENVVAKTIISKQLRRVLCDIDDNNCMIVEFPNNEFNLQTGFLSWLKEKDINNIDKLIEQEEMVEVYWPLDTVIQPKKNILKTLKTANFSKVVGVIKARGDWTTMRSQIKSFKTTGKLNVSKGSRKIFKKQYITSTPIKHSPTLGTKKMKGITNKYQDKQLISQIQEEKVLFDNIFSSNDSDEESGNEIETNVRVEVEKIKNNEDETVTKRKPTPLNVDEDDIVFKTKSKNPLKRVRSESITPSKLKRIEARKGANNEDKDEDKNISLSMDSDEEIVDPNEAATVDSEDDVIVKATSKNSLKNVKNQLIRNKRRRIEIEKEENNDGKERSKNTSISSIESNEATGQNYDLPNGIKRRFPLPRTIIHNLPTKSVQAYVSAMVDNFFETSYLKVHSATGKVLNCNKTMVPKSALHPPTMQYIRECVEKVFGSGKGIKGKISKTISDKISTARADNTRA